MRLQGSIDGVHWVEMSVPVDSVPFYRVVDELGIVISHMTVQALMKPKVCEHPKDHFEMLPHRPDEGRCGVCGVKLKAKWEVVE